MSREPTAESRPEPRAESRPEPTAESRPEPTAESRPEPRAESRPESRKPDTAESPAPRALTAQQRRKAAAIAAIGAPIIKAVGSTYRWRVEGLAHYESIVASGKQPIFAFWHGRILPATLFWRDRGIIVITSRNFDGEWIARIIQRFGYGTARGSSSRGGARALVQLRRDLADGRPAAFTIDGPRGPARVAQPGAVFLSGATGQPIVPFHIEASRFWTAGRWDQTQIPKPFSTVAVAIGAPMTVPSTDEETVERCRRELEGILSELERRARQTATAG